MRQISKLGVLMPVYNAGPKLAASLNSCAFAGLSPDEYEIIIVDNASTDNSTTDVPATDRAGAPVRLFRNETNIGRIANWNRAIDIAIEAGFHHVTFLFAGDRWTNGTALPGLLRAIREHDAVIAFAPFVICDETGRIRRESRRFHIQGDFVIRDDRVFLRTLLESGLFPLGPIQANIYRIGPEEHPVFDDREPARTDVEATLRFVNDARSPVVIGSEPFVAWQEHPDRFHMSMGAGQTVRDYMRTFQSACALTGLRVHHRRAKARVILNSLRLMVSDAPLAQWPAVLSAIGECAFRTRYQVRVRDFLAALWSRFVRGRRLLQFG